MMSEFKAFAMKGNLVDLAVGFVMGAAFTSVTTKDFSDWTFVLREGKTDATGVITTPAIVIQYGTFISAVIYFLIVAFVMFMVIKAINATKRKEADVPAAPPAPTKEEILLTEIRDLLKK